MLYFNYIFTKALWITLVGLPVWSPLFWTLHLKTDDTVASKTQRFFLLGWSSLNHFNIVEFAYPLPCFLRTVCPQECCNTWRLGLDWLLSSTLFCWLVPLQSSWAGPVLMYSRKWWLRPMFQDYVGTAGQENGKGWRRNWNHMNCAGFRLGKYATDSACKCFHCNWFLMWGDLIGTGLS